MLKSPSAGGDNNQTHLGEAAIEEDVQVSENRENCNGQQEFEHSCQKFLRWNLSICGLAIALKAVLPAYRALGLARPLALVFKVLLPTTENREISPICDGALLDRLR